MGHPQNEEGYHEMGVGGLPLKMEKDVLRLQFSIVEKLGGHQSTFKLFGSHNSIIVTKVTTSNTDF